MTRLWAGRGVRGNPIGRGCRDWVVGAPRDAVVVGCVDAGEVALTLGGTALFVTGHALFKRAVFGELPWPDLVAILLLAALVPLGFASPALSAAAALILVGLAVWETVTPPGRRPWPHRSAA